MGPRESYTGKRLTVAHCEGALDSLNAALVRISKQKRDSLLRQMVVQIERLANGERLSTAHFPKEGSLPALKGKQKRHFYALKRIPLRAYCWYSEKHRATVFISHYIYKDQDNLSGQDIERVANNWRKIEE